MRTLRFATAADPFSPDTIELRCAFIDTTRAVIAETEPIIFTERPLDEYVVSDKKPAMLTLKQDEARQLMDSLWEAGVRPGNHFGSAGHLAATMSHLDDMRKIVFHKLGIGNEHQP